MATIMTYAQMAASVYHLQTANQVEGFELVERAPYSWFGNGFQGAIYANGEEVICAFKGTKLGNSKSNFSDVVADLGMGLGILPNQAGNAHKLYLKAKELADGRPVTVVGHSLGGALAQIVATWNNTPFVSFNAPGMKYELKLAKFNIFKIRQMVRTHKGASSSNVPGWNFRILGDPVSKFGHHVGVVVPLSARTPMGSMGKHLMNAVIDSLQTCDWGHMEAFCLN